jgi:hypothetical protein
VTDMLPALVTAAAGLAVLVLVVLLALRPVRRLRRASTALRDDTGARMAILQNLVNARQHRHE